MYDGARGGGGGCAAVTDGGMMASALGCFAVAHSAMLLLLCVCLLSYSSAVWREFRRPVPLLSVAAAEYNSTAQRRRRSCGPRSRLASGPTVRHVAIR